MTPGLWTALTVYLFAVNLLAFAVSASDKRRARRKRRRVPEKTLFFLAAAGGAVGLYLSMLFLRHKTRHLSFTLGVPAIFLVQAALALFFITRAQS